MAIHKYESKYLVVVFEKTHCTNSPHILILTAYMKDLVAVVEIHIHINLLAI
jgi:hypothetical protein